MEESLPDDVVSPPGSPRRRRRERNKPPLCVLSVSPSALRLREDLGQSRTQHVREFCNIQLFYIRFTSSHCPTASLIGSPRTSDERRIRRCRFGPLAQSFTPRAVSYALSRVLHCSAPTTLTVIMKSAGLRFSKLQLILAMASFGLAILIILNVIFG